ncbi:MAG: polysaccharide biosynthesis tyrosine autokinase [Actinobacteria bacterium]|nr:MAG: polysaccharide biosynthesis tyrosine autokinase [Actinomycetota bacterium]
MELRDYLRVLRARKWVVVRAVLVVAIAAVAASLLQQPTFTAETSVLVSPDSGSGLFSDLLGGSVGQPERALMTQVQLMQLRPLAENTIRKLNLQTDPASLLSNVAVAAAGQTNIVVIKVTAHDPKLAAEVANTLANEYVTWSRETRQEALKEAAVQVESRLAVAREEILAVGRKLSEDSENDELAAQMDMATGGYATLAEKLEQLRIDQELETGAGRIVSPAVGTNYSSSPGLVRNGLLGLALGLVLGIAMAFLYEYLDDAIKSSEEAERLLGTPVLGHVPIERFEKGESRRLTIVEKPGSPAAEAYRVIRNSLDFVNFERNIKTILVTSAAPGEGKSTVASNLAASLAQAGQKVALISCDFRRPTTEAFFGVPNTVGLSDVLTGRHSMKAVLQRPGDEQLLVMTSGKMPPNPSELLSSRKMKETLDSLEEWADWIIIDTPPVLAVSDAAALARWVDGVLMITRAGSSTREATRKAREMLEKAGARLVGCVVWGLEPGGGPNAYGGAYAYYGGYYYHDYYTGGGQKKAGKGAAGGARGSQQVSAAEADTEWVPSKSPGRRFAEFLGRAIAGLLGALLVLAIVATITWALDAYFDWGLVEAVRGAFPVP